MGDQDVDLTAVTDRLAELRKTRGLNLSELADLTGYSVSYLSQIERGQSVPSLSALATVAVALDVELAAFFDQLGQPAVHVTRSDHGLRLRTGSEDRERPNEYIVLGAHGMEGAFTALLHVLPHAEEPVTYRHFGERFGLVLSGTARVNVSDQCLDVGPGDWLHYSSHGAHTFEATSAEPVLILWVVCPAIL